MEYYMSYLGKAPGVPGGVRQVYEFVATDGQTVFSGVDRNGLTLNYTAGYINVTVGGVGLSQEDYTAVDGTSVTVRAALPAGRIVQVEAFGVFSQANMLPLTGGALTGAVTGITAAQLDNSTKLATTAFVKKTGLAFSDGGKGITVNTTLTLSHVGSFVEFGANVIATLPPVATVTPGSTITFRTYSFVGTIKGNGAEVIVAGLSAGSNTYAIMQGETITLASNGISWYAVAHGFGNLSFASSKNANGYQKLPGGLIIQWGYWISQATVGQGVAVTFPLTFPVAVTSTIFGVAINTPSLAGAWALSGTNSGFIGACNNSGIGCKYIALGY